MHTLNANIIILSTEISDDKISGKAIDIYRDINVNYSTVNNNDNRSIFIPKANLVISGKFRIGKEVATVGVWIHTIVAVVSLPNIEAILTTSVADIEGLESSQPLETTIEPVTLVEPATPAKSVKKAGSRSSSKRTSAKTNAKAIAS
jgi:hypothetical protein